MSKDEQFQIFYDGPALDTGEMDIQELAPSLLAFGELFTAANRVLNGNKTEIRINVKTGFPKGSFGVDLTVFQGVADTVKSLFGDSPITDISSLLKVVLGSGGVIGLFELIRRSKGKKPDKATIIKDGNVSLEFKIDDSEVEKVVVNQNTFNIYRDVESRKSLEKFTRPVQKHGIDNIKVKIKDEEWELLSKDDWRYFVAPEVEQELLKESEEITFLSIHTIVFGGDDKWRFSDGQSVNWYKISDYAFLNRVNQNQQSFSKGDILKVRLLKTVWQTSGGLKTEYTLLEVLEHKKAAQQISISFGVSGGKDGD